MILKIIGYIGAIICFLGVYHLLIPYDIDSTVLLWTIGLVILTICTALEEVFKRFLYERKKL